MKTVISFFSLILISILVHGQEYVDVDSRISYVSVFPDRAQITRETSASINPGKSLLRISGLSPYVDPASIQVKGEGDFMIIAVNNRINYLEETGEPDDVKKLRSRIDELKMKIEDEKTGIEILREKEAFLTANRVIGGKNENISAQELKSITDLYTASIESVRKGILEKNRLIVKYEEEKQKFENQLNGTVRSARTPSSEVIISVSASKTAAARITLSYLVSRAGWYPSYDIRVEDINENVSIFYKANVYQNTGIDWNNALLGFSNASPSVSGTVPELLPYYLNFYQPIMIRGISSRTKSAAIPEAVSEAALNEMQYDLGEAVEIADAGRPPVNIVNTGTAFSFEVDMPQNVSTDGKTNTLELQRISAAADYKYVSIPKLRKEAFLTANIPDWESLNLLDGEANIYFGNTFTGTTVLNTNQISDTLNVSLGIDNSISIEREKRKEYTRERTIGANRIDTRSFIVSVRNNKSVPIDIIIYDQVPISQNKDIEVETEELTGGILDEYTGEVQWKTTIPARESKQYILTYTVKYPKNQKVILE